MPFADDSAFLEKFAEIKHENKKDFGAWLARHQDTAFDPDTLLDAQAKRLHEYKRQLLNVLHILSLYNRIVDDPTFEIKPRTFLFGAKAAPGTSAPSSLSSSSITWPRWSPRIRAPAR